MRQREEILDKAQALILSRLQERTSLDIPAIGVFQPLFRSEYILEGEEGRLLIPPHVSLSYLPAEYLLNAKHYTTLDHESPKGYFATDFTSNLSDLHGWDEGEVAETLSSYLKELLEGLFKGRRVILLELGDLFVTEEVASVLLLNFIPNTTLLQSLNTPFSIYKETKLRADLELADTEVRQSRITEESALQYAIHEPVPETKPEPKSESEIIPIVKQLPLPHREEEKKGQKSHRLWLIPVLIVVAGLLIFLLNRRQEPIPATVETLSPPADTLLTEQTTVVAPFDTVMVPKGGSLAAVAREYYGNALFWVYVFIANADSIPNPDNLQPGQSLIVPPLEWYTLKSDSIEANKEAKAWATVILNRKFSSYEAQRPQLKIQP
ncbi:LysM peptidoglycan-binding domain-containing protein [Porphyromonas levii]|uniref:LysM peptidoglycan-binding domain-containing protein n=1 Tax=Porphyromonas levii TaxID=28114 RepID=UPI001BA78397|nr:hypothetical protein [Porphyromonas levii]MBR8766245.1 hypothetical protein [Porphyromonas levii]MBR8802714.1 hypothetical protein [Porphyromonas levii]